MAENCIKKEGYLIGIKAAKGIDVSNKIDDTAKEVSCIEDFFNNFIEGVDAGKKGLPELCKNCENKEKCYSSEKEYASRN
jgi:hypothetical protein